MIVLFCHLRHDNHIWLDLCCYDVLLQLQMLAQINTQLPVRDHVEGA